MTPSLSPKIDMTDIADIKPDTSLYSTRGDRLRAMGAVADAHDSGATVQTRRRNEPHSGWAEPPDASVDSPNFLDYRIKPKLRELWVIEGPNGKLIGRSASPREIAVYESMPDAAIGHTAVRFMEHRGIGLNDRAQS